MTKEELEQEAERYSYDVPIYQVKQQLEKIQKAYLAGAEPREKRIAELELKIKHLTVHLEPQAMTSLFEQVEEEVRQEQMIEKLNSQNAELEEQIEKMKRHSNCKYRSEYNEFDPYNKVCQSCCNLEKWEFGL